MPAILHRFFEWLNGAGLKKVHLHVLVMVALLEAAAVLATLIFPNPVRLEMAKDVGIVLMGVLGVVGTVHAAKKRMEPKAS